MCRAAALALALAAAPGTASAAGFFVETGGGWVTSFEGDGAGAAMHAGAGLLGEVSPTVSLGARLRLHVVPGLSDDQGVLFLATGRWQRPLGTATGWLGAGAGLGTWSVSAAGGGGLAANLEAGAEIPVAWRLVFGVALDATAQTGMANGVGTMLVPSMSLVLGVR